MAKPEISLFNTARLAPKHAAVIVAHPDDEVLWAGGYILTHPGYRWLVITLTRKRDPDRAPKFYNVLERLQATGCMGDLDDGPKQIPLPQVEVETAILALLQPHDFELILTHGKHGEYTRHRRHEEVSAAVGNLWQSGQISTQQLWMFAYEDGQGRYLPRVNSGAHYHQELSPEIWQKKYELITEVYGFSPYSWEARATPQVEAFWDFKASIDRTG